MRLLASSTAQSPTTVGGRNGEARALSAFGVVLVFRQTGFSACLHVDLSQASKAEALLGKLSLSHRLSIDVDRKVACVSKPLRLTDRSADGKAARQLTCSLAEDDSRGQV